MPCHMPSLAHGHSNLPFKSPHTQRVVPVYPTDSAKKLAARVLKEVCGLLFHYR